MSALVALDALGPSGEYRTRKPELVTDTRGVPIAELSLVPRLFVIRSVAAQRKVKPLPLDERMAALRRAADIFRTEHIAGLDFDSYVALTQRSAGLPMDVARAGADVVVDSLATVTDAVRPAQPAGSTADWRYVRVRRRRGVDAQGRSARGTRTGERTRRARAVATGAGARLSRRGEAVAPRAAHRPSAGTRLAAGGFSRRGRTVPADGLRGRRRTHRGRRPVHGVRRPGRRGPLRDRSDRAGERTRPDEDPDHRRA